MYKINFITSLLFVAVFSINLPVSAQIHNGHAYVDLGLPSGTMWATCNIGATSPEDYGDYYAWGEIKTKKEYNNITYSLINGKEEHIKYNAKDNKTELDLIDDVAHVKWGGNWRMPSKEQCQELIDNCTWKWDEDKDGVNVKSDINGNSIFLPAAGRAFNKSILGQECGRYWSRSLVYDSYNDQLAGQLSFQSYVFVDYCVDLRLYGYPIRPVCNLTK